MNISLLQGILLMIAGMLFGLDFWLEALFIFRPLIVSTITGLILGDLQLGLVTGALCELAFAGLTPAGGTQPPNPILAGVMITVIAHTTKVDAKAALGLALPFSFLMQYIILTFYSTFAFFMPKVDAYAAKADTDGIRRINLTTSAIVTVTYGIIIFLSTYVAQDGMRWLVEHMPEFLTHGLEVAGGILPAVGFGMLLRVMLKAKYVPYLIAGFLFSTFIDIPNLLPVALMGTAFALYDYFSKKDVKEAVETVVDDRMGGGTDVGL